MSLATVLVDQARWLESMWPEYHPADVRARELEARIELAWRAVRRARDEERADAEHDTLPSIPRISVLP